MASTLDGDTENDRVIGRGHGTSALGPSDTSDTGSDITGGPGLIEGDVLGLDAGTNEDVDVDGPIRTAGPDIGDSNVDSDSDSVGTGEHLTAGRDPEFRPDGDRLPDRIDRVLPDDLPDDGLTGSESSGLATDRGGGTTGSGRTPTSTGGV